MATRVAAAGGGNWTVGATWVGGVAPTAADDAQLTAASGNVTIDTGAVCRSLDCSTYIGTLTHTSGVTLAIGDGTAGASSIALKLVAGMTYTLGNASTSAINFVSTAAGTQTIDWGGKTTGNLTLAGTGNTFSFSSAHTTTGTVTLTSGQLNTNGQTCSWGVLSSSNTNTRFLTLGSSTITITGTSDPSWNMQNTTNLTFSGASSTINFTGTSTFMRVANTAGSAQTFGTVNATGAGDFFLNAIGSTFANFNRTGTAAKTCTFTVAFGGFIVTGILTLAGNSATNRVLVQSNTVGTARTITNTGATMTWSNVDFMDITLGTSFDASAITGLSGDCGGNTNITFTTPATQTYTGGTGNWSDVSKWTSRVPLPQDNVLMSGVTGGTITADMPRLGKSIDWTGAAGSPTWSFASLSVVSLFGSLTLVSGMTLSTANSITFAGRSTYTITSAGNTYLQNISITAPGGTYSLLDALSISGSSLNLLNGTFTTNDFNITCNSFNNGSTATRVFNGGTSTFTLTRTTAGSAWAIPSTGLTFSGASMTIVISGASASTRNFDGNGQTYGTLTYTVAGSTGTLIITGSNTFNTINFSDVTNARTLQFTAGTTTTVTNFNVFGTAGKLMSVQSVTAATHTLTKPSGTVSGVNYVNLTNSIATGGAAWYAGANSTDSGGNTGWIFTAAPVVVTTGSLTQYSSQEAMNYLYGSRPLTQYSVQTIANLQVGNYPTQSGFRALLNAKLGVAPFTYTEQEALYLSLTTALSLSGSRSQYSPQNLLNLMVYNSVPLTTIL